MLGIDPFEVANEGKVIMSVQPEKADEIWKPSEKENMVTKPRSLVR